jgi:hypothetical protein
MGKGFVDGMEARGAAVASGGFGVLGSEFSILHPASKIQNRHFNNPEH